MKKISHERESTFKVPVSRELFNTVYDLVNPRHNRCTCNESMLPELRCIFCQRTKSSADRYKLEETVILIFDNDTRLASRVYQSKRIETRKFVAVFTNGRFFPILRTYAVEKVETLPKSTDDLPQVSKAIYRVIVTKLDATKRDGVSTRFSFNKEEDAQHGVFYNMACETEYSMTATYREIMDNEQTMIQDYYDFISLVELRMDAQTLNDLFASVVPKVQMWSCFDPTLPYKWAYKWNGVKAKSVVKNDRILLWPDSAPVQTLRYDGDLSAIDKIAFQVEIMPMCVVLIHAISVSFFDKIYNIEPYTGIQVLDHLHRTLQNVIVTNKDRTLSVPLIVQRFHDDQPCPETFPMDRFDGFIFAQDLLFIKWKQPTIDVKYLGNNTFKVGDDKTPIMFTLDEEERAEDKCEEDNIYELSSKLSILRKRIDRLHCSTTREYELFVKSIKLLDLSKDF